MFLGEMIATFFRSTGIWKSRGKIFKTLLLFFENDRYLHNELNKQHEQQSRGKLNLVISKFNTGTVIFRKAPYTNYWRCSNIYFWLPYTLNRFMRIFKRTWFPDGWELDGRLNFAGGLEI